MQDRPTIQELIEAIQEFLLKDLLPELKSNDSLSYKTLVSWNMLGVISREFKTDSKKLEREKELLINFLKIKNLNFNEKSTINEMSYVLQKYIRDNFVSNEDSDLWYTMKEILKLDLEIVNPRFLKSDDSNE
jgi:hypothetical protein